MGWVVVGIAMGSGRDLRQIPEGTCWQIAVWIPLRIVQGIEHRGRACVGRSCEVCATWQPLARGGLRCACWGWDAVPIFLCRAALRGVCMRGQVGCLAH